MNLPIAGHASVPTQLTREDLAAIAAVHHRALRKFDVIGVCAIIGGLSVALLLTILAEQFSWPDALAPFFLIGGWVIGGAGALFARQVKQQRVRELDVACASCGAKLVSGRGQAAVTRADLVVATGNCPSCGRDFITGEA